MKLGELFSQVTNSNQLTEAKRSYGCVMLFFPVPKGFWDKIQKRVPDDAIHSDKDEDGEEKNGRLETESAHVTILYGIHDDVPDEDVEAIIDTISNVEVTLRQISTFNTNDEFDVLKFDVEGDGLHEFNKKFKELPHTDSYPKYHPHLTILYAKKGDLTSDMTKDLTGDDILVTTSNKAVYSKADGTEKTYELN